MKSETQGPTILSKSEEEEMIEAEGWCGVKCRTVRNVGVETEVNFKKITFWKEVRFCTKVKSNTQENFG